MAAVLEIRLRQAQSEKLAPIDLVSMQAGFRDPDRSLDTFDCDFNKKMNRALIHELATGVSWIEPCSETLVQIDGSSLRTRTSRRSVKRSPIGRCISIDLRATCVQVRGHYGGG